MTRPRTGTLIVGGNSSIARHLLGLLPDARAVARTGGRPDVIAVGDYRRLDPVDFEEVRTVINCAGIVNGTEAALQAINVDLQGAVARFARAAGATRYIAISSFSVFGLRERIDRSTPTAPDDAYGRSKLQGDQVLRTLQTDCFKTLSVAFPTIIGTTRAGKVERMLRLWRRTGIWPVPSVDIVRSMIGAEGAARVLASAAADDATGLVLAADPVAFSYREVAQWLREDVGGSFLRLRVPRAGQSLFRRILPSVYRSTMTDSLLEPSFNYAIKREVKSSIRRELAGSILQSNHR